MEAIRASSQSKDLQIPAWSTKLVDEINVSRLEGEFLFCETFYAIVFLGISAAVQQIIQEFVVGVKRVEEFFDVI